MSATAKAPLAPRALCDNVLAAPEIVEPEATRATAMDDGGVHVTRLHKSWLRRERQTLIVKSAERDEVLEFARAVGAGWFLYERADLGAIYARFLRAPQAAQAASSNGNLWRLQCELAYYNDGWALHLPRGIRATAWWTTAQDVERAANGRTVFEALPGYNAPANLSANKIDGGAAGYYQIDLRDEAGLNDNRGAWLIAGRTSGFDFNFGSYAGEKFYRLALGSFVLFFDNEGGGFFTSGLTAASGAADVSGTYNGQFVFWHYLNKIAEDFTVAVLSAAPTQADLDAWATGAHDAAGGSLFGGLLRRGR